MKHVLFVDDEPRILEGLEDRLMRYRNQWTMRFLGSGEAALAMLEHERFDVIVSDMRMPKMDGPTLLSLVKERHPHMVRIVLSGFSELEAALRAVPVAHQFLTKPCEPHVLENVIERACSLHGLIADENLKRIIGKVQRLPSVPRVYGELLTELADERTGARDVAELLESDIAMTAKVLQLVNSAFFGLGRQITDVVQAVSYLGFSLVKNLVLTIEVFEMDGTPEVGRFSLEHAQGHALTVAEIAAHILAEDRQQREDVFMASVLHDIGKLVLAHELPGEFGHMRLQACDSKRPGHVVEREVLGTTHAEVGGYLLGLWGLPYTVVEAVANHHAPERVAQKGLDVLTAVVVANALVNERVPDPLGIPHDRLDVAYLEGLGLGDRVAEWSAFADAQLRTRAA